MHADSICTYGAAKVLYPIIIHNLCEVCLKGNKESDWLNLGLYHLTGVNHCSPVCLFNVRFCRMWSNRHVRAHLSFSFFFLHRNVVFCQFYPRNCCQGREQGSQCYSGTRRLDKAVAVVEAERERERLTTPSTALFFFFFHPHQSRPRPPSPFPPHPGQSTWFNPEQNAAWGSHHYHHHHPRAWKRRWWWDGRVFVRTVAVERNERIWEQETQMECCIVAAECL